MRRDEALPCQGLSTPRAEIVAAARRRSRWLRRPNDRRPTSDRVQCRRLDPDTIQVSARPSRPEPMRESEVRLDIRLERTRQRGCAHQALSPETHSVITAVLALRAILHP